MSRVEAVKGQIKALREPEFRAFREWFVQDDAAVWDQQIEANAGDGKLPRLAEKALRDHENGHSAEL